MVYVIYILAHFCFIYLIYDVFSPIPVPDLLQYSKNKSLISKFYRFDLSNYRSDAGSDQLTEAEFKLRQVPNTRKITEQRFSLYQLIPSQTRAPKRKYLYTKVVNSGEHGWITFDVTDTVREWITRQGNKSETN